MPNPASNNGAGYAGLQQPQTPLGDYGAMAFIVQSLVGKMATVTICKVLAVTNAGGVEPVGFVDLQPMVNQIDGAGVAHPHSTIYHCPYFRLQGGTDAIILDPRVDDLGIALFASSDISSVCANKGQANPGSRRRFDWADGIYIGGLLNGIPVQYVQFSAAGIKLESPVMVQIHAPTALVQCDTAAIEATGDASITAGGNVDVEADGDASVSAGGNATVAGTNTTIRGSASVDLETPNLEYNGTRFDPTSVAGLPNPTPSDSPDSTPGNVVFAAVDGQVTFKRRKSDGTLEGIQWDLGPIP